MSTLEDLLAEWHDMTWNDLVRQYFPNADDEMANFILWELTCFPLGSAEQVKEQLAHIKEIGIEAAIRERNAAIENEPNCSMEEDK